MIKYIVPFLFAFLSTIFLLVIGLRFGSGIKWRERKSWRHIHGQGVYRIGGIAMIIAFNLAILFNQDLVITSGLWGMLVASWLLLAIGLWDDIKEMFWQTQLFYQVASAVFAFIMGVRIYYLSNPLTGEIIKLDSSWGILVSIAIAITWIVLMMNSMNWLDGIDGLSGGVTFIGALTIFFLSLKPEVNQPAVAILAMILAGVSLAFLVFNFNPSRVLAGTTGSLFMGFALASLAIFAGTKIATTILVMSLPVMDFVWVIGKRLKNRKSIFLPDKSHLHFQLLDLGWSQKETALFFYMISALLATVALNTRFIGKSVAIGLVAVIMIVVIVIINKKRKKK